MLDAHFSHLLYPLYIFTWATLILFLKDRLVGRKRRKRITHRDKESDVVEDTVSERTCFLPIQLPVLVKPRELTSAVWSGLPAEKDVNMHFICSEK